MPIVYVPIHSQFPFRNVCCMRWPQFIFSFQMIISFRIPRDFFIVIQSCDDNTVIIFPFNRLLNVHYSLLLEHIYSKGAKWVSFDLGEYTL